MRCLGIVDWLHTHFLYADDLLVFCLATRANMRVIFAVFTTYGILLGQVVSSPKSAAYLGFGIIDRRAAHLYDMVGVSMGQLRFLYLGVPIFYRAQKKRLLQCVADKVLSQFTNWKGQTLSYAGRFALITLVIHGSLIHFFLVYKWPDNLLNQLQKAMCNFL